MAYVKDADKNFLQKLVENLACIIGQIGVWLGFGSGEVTEMLEKNTVEVGIKSPSVLSETNRLGGVTMAEATSSVNEFMKLMASDEAETIFHKNAFESPKPWMVERMRTDHGWDSDVFDLKPKYALIEKDDMYHPPVEELDDNVRKSIAAYIGHPIPDEAIATRPDLIGSSSITVTQVDPWPKANVKFGYIFNWVTDNEIHESLEVTMQNDGKLSIAVLDPPLNGPMGNSVCFPAGKDSQRELLRLISKLVEGDI